MLEEDNREAWRQPNGSSSVVRKAAWALLEGDGEVGYANQEGNMIDYLSFFRILNLSLRSRLHINI